jgi:hypothetical protein
LIELPESAWRRFQRAKPIAASGSRAKDVTFAREKLA